jgi:hypothetical protein
MKEGQVISLTGLGKSVLGHCVDDTRILITKNAIPDTIPYIVTDAYENRYARNDNIHHISVFIYDKIS